jgi:hypothetical protein
MLARCCLEWSHEAHYEGREDMLPDPGCYDEHYRRGRAVFGLAPVLPPVGLGLLLQHQLFFVLHGNEQVRVSRYPVSGLAAGATLRIKGWRLDREQLAAVTAAVAPGILVIDARKDPGLRIEGPRQRQDRQLWVV